MGRGHAGVFGKTLSRALRRILAHRWRAIAGIVAALTCHPGVPTPALADEGGVSLWTPGFFGSLAATPAQTGFSFVVMYYHTSVSAGADVAFDYGKENVRFLEGGVLLDESFDSHKYVHTVRSALVWRFNFGSGAPVAARY